MNFIKHCFIAALILFCARESYGQLPTPASIEPTRLKAPASPNATHLGTYGDFKVSKATGSAQVSIPLFTIEDYGISIPVSLGYQSMGLRVEERPSMVGMGFVLNCGGVILRTSKGIPDDHSHGFLANKLIVPSQQLIENDLNNEDYQYDVYNRLEQWVVNSEDFQPDQFSFNFGNHGGAFFFGNDGLVYTVEQSELKFEPLFGTYDGVGNVITDWKVTDENGLIYIFSHKETTETFISADVRMDEHVTAWYLSKIVNPITKAYAVFSYDPTAYTYQQDDNSKTINYKKSVNTWIVDGSPVNSQQHTDFYDLKYPTSIALNDNTVIFSLAASYKNLPRLDAIQWTKGSFIKKFSFGYGAFDCFGSNCDRLQLQSLTEEHPIHPKIHQFEYYPGQVPPVDSYSQDHWGFYNAANNSDMIPRVFFAGQQLGGTAIREPNSSATKIGMLSKITYPTAGYTTFNYELHGYADVKTITDIEIESVVNTELDISENNCQIDDAVVGIANGYQYTFEVDYGLTTGITFTGKVDPYLQLIEYPSTVVQTVYIKGTNTVSWTNQLVAGKSYFVKLCSVEGATAWANIEVARQDVTIISTPIERKVGGLRVSSISSYTGVLTEPVKKTFDYGYGGYKVIDKLPEYYRTSMVAIGNPEVWNSREEVPHLHIGSSSTGGLAPSSVAVAYEKVIEKSIGRVETYFRNAMDESHAGYLPRISHHNERSQVMQEKYFDSDNQLVQTDDYVYSYGDRSRATVFGVERAFTKTDYVVKDWVRDFRFNNYTLWSTWARLAQKKTTLSTPTGTFVSSVSYEYDPFLHKNVKSETTVNSSGESLRKEYTYAIDGASSKPDCETIYQQGLSDCRTMLNQHAIDPYNCTSTYASCYTAWKNALAPINTDPATLYDLTYRAALNKSANDQFKTCLQQTNAYSGCTNTTETSQKCVKREYYEYIGCLTEFDNGIYTEYLNNSGNAKAIALTNIANQRTKPTEIVLDNNDIKVESWHMEYGISSGIPVAKTVSHALKNNPAIPLTTVNAWDAKGNPTEVLDNKTRVVNAYLWGYDGRVLIAEFQNASLADVGHSSFENGSSEGGLSFTYTSASAGAKTGSSSHNLTSAPISKNVTPSKKYVISYWAKNGVPSVSGSQSVVQGTQESDGWTYFEHLVTGVSQIQISGNAAIDEVRIAPENAMVHTLTHKVGVGLASSTDQNNITTYYNHDSHGYLASVEDHYHNIVKHLRYHFKIGSSVPIPPDPSVE
jgi:hypothetical protein